MYINIHMYTYMYVPTYIYVYTCIYLYVFTYTYNYTHIMYACMYALQRKGSFPKEIQNVTESTIINPTPFSATLPFMCM